MRIRQGNFYREAHGGPMRVLEFVAPVGTSPHDVPVWLERAHPELQLIPRDTGINGYVNTSLRPDGSLFVAVNLFDYACDGRSCAYEHLVPIQQAPRLAPPHLAMLKHSVGEHDEYQLGSDEAHNRRVLQRLGFGRHGHPDHLAICDGCPECIDAPLRESA